MLVLRGNQETDIFVIRKFFLHDVACFWILYVYVKKKSLSFYSFGSNSDILLFFGFWWVLSSSFKALSKILKSWNKQNAEDLFQNIKIWLKKTQTHILVYEKNVKIYFKEKNSPGLKNCLVRIKLIICVWYISKTFF